MDKLPEARKLKYVVLHQAIDSGNLASLAVGAKDILELVPAQLQADGDWFAIDKGQRADGIGVRQKKFGGGKPFIQRRFIPWANVVELGYGEP